MDIEEQYAKICLDVLSKIKPKEKDKSTVEAIYQDISSKINEILTKNSIEAEITLSGSFSRDTWLAKVKDIDIFIVLPYDSKYEPDTIISLIREHLDLPWERRHAEHPYLYAEIEKIAIEIIPGYQFKYNRKIRSAVDRSPAHKKFIISNLPLGSNDEVRLLKQFMGGIGIYGAEVKTHGFSGYLVELLIIHHQGKFFEVIKHAKSLLKTTITFNKNDDTPKEFKNDALVVIDPVDSSRNVASAVSIESLTKFIAAAEMFLLQPKIEFFFPKDLVITNKILTEMKESTVNYTAIIHPLPKIVNDVLWGQIRKLESSLFGYLTTQGINPLKIDSTLSNKKIITVVISEHNFSPEKLWLLGPPVEIASSEKFLEKYRDNPSTLYGPEIINGRWQILLKKDKIRIDALIKKAFSEKIVTMPSHLRLDSSKIKILLQEKFVNDLATDHETLAFLYYMIKGKPRYLH